MSYKEILDHPISLKLIKHFTRKCQRKQSYFFTINWKRQKKSKKNFR